MALGHQSKDKDKMPYGYIRGRVDSVATSTRANLPPIVGIGDFDLEDKFFELKAFDSTGREQLMKLFHIDHATGIVEVTIQEWIAKTDTRLGDHVDVELVQACPQSSGVTGWKYLAGKAKLVLINAAPSEKEPGKQKIRIIPYNDAGTALFTFTVAQTITA